MPRSLCILTLILILPLLGLLARPTLAQQLSDPFKPDWLAPNDLRFLQTGLTLEGLYLGLIDGKWGAGSQGALDKFLAGRVSSGQVTYRDLMPLMQRTLIAVQADFWQGVNDFDERATFLAPMAVVQQDRGSELFTLHAPDGSLKVRLIDNDKDKTIEMHQWLLDNHAGTKQDLYQNYTDTRLITSGVLKSGKTVYLRSQYAKSGTIVTVLVQYEPWQKSRGQLIAASISYDGRSDLSLDQYSALAALMRQAAPPARPSQPIGGGGSGGGISRPAPGTGPAPAQPGTGGGGIGIARPAPGNGPQPAAPGSGGIGGGISGGGGIARPSVPIASQSFTIPPLPPATE